MAREAARDPLAGPDADHGLAPAGARPGARMLVVRRDPGGGARVLDRARWGVPREGGDPVLHLRAETVLAQPGWERAIRHRRLLVPIDGYVQCATRGSAAGFPHWVAPGGDAPLAVAGVWASEEQGLRFAILTRPATGLVAAIHDRMPVIIPPASWPLWLGEHDLLREGLALLMAAEPLDGLDVTARRPRRTAREGGSARQQRLLGLEAPGGSMVSSRRVVAASIPRGRRRALG